MKNDKFPIAKFYHSISIILTTFKTGHDFQKDEFVFVVFNWNSPSMQRRRGFLELQKRSKFSTRTLFILEMITLTRMSMDLTTGPRSAEGRVRALLTSSLRVRIQRECVSQMLVKHLEFLWFRFK